MEPIFTIVIISVLGPIIGSAIGVGKNVSDRFVYNTLAFAAGIMLTISFTELIPEAIHLASIPMAALGVLIGALAMFFLDKAIPHFHPTPQGHHDCRCEGDTCERVKVHAKKLEKQVKQPDLKKTAVYLIAGIFIHNFPEGMAIASLRDPTASLAVAIAIAIHNIPEGICTSAPYYHATQNRLKAFLLSSTTAIPVLLGFLFAYFLFQNIPASITGIITAATAGLMIYISADELIPTSCSKLSNYSTVFSLIFGVVFSILLSML